MQRSARTIRRACRPQLKRMAAVIVAIMIPYSLGADGPLDELTVAYAYDMVPFGFTDEGGHPAGVLIDLWRLWSEKTGIPVRFRDASWNETLSLVRSGEVDAHFGLFYSEERDHTLDFGAPLMEMETHYFRHRSLPPIVQARGLAAFRVGVLAGDYAEQHLKELLPENCVVPFTDYSSLMSALKEGALQVFAADTPVALHHLALNGLSAEFTHRSHDVLYRNRIRCAVQEGSTAMIEEIDRGMALITEGEKRDLSRRWTEGVEHDEKTLVIGISRDLAPLTFVNSLGRPSGMLVDLWRVWAQQTGLHVQFRATGWSETLSGLRVGDIDAHSGLSICKERAEWVGFSTQIYATASRVYYRIGFEPPGDISDYGASAIGVGFDTYQEARLQEDHPSANIRS